MSDDGRIYLSAPDVTETEIEAVVRAMRSGWIAPLGPEVDAFEQEIAEFVGRKYAIALSSGTAALHLALLCVGACPGTRVATSTMTFAATANAIVYTGAEPIFIDSDDSGNMNPALLDQALDDQARKGHNVVAVLPVDLFGKMADYDALDAVATARGLPLISDAAESLGATRSGKRAGQEGLAAAISFNGNKIMTTSGGGALVTDDKAIAERSRYLSTQARQPVAHYEHTEIGYNYRLSNILAALGRAQLARLPEMIGRRRSRRQRYRDFFGSIAGTSVFGGSDGVEDSIDHDNFWLTSILVDSEIANWTPEELIDHLKRQHIEARRLWKPMHRQPVFRTADAYLSGQSDDFFASGVSLPSGSSLSDSEFDRILDAIANFVEGR